MRITSIQLSMITTVIYTLFPETSPQACLGFPARGHQQPEVYYDNGFSSIVIDWSNSTTSSCLRDFLEYEVQNTAGCNTPTTLIQSHSSPAKHATGGCGLANCYVRIRALVDGDNPAWTAYSLWIGLARNYVMVEACVVKGYEACIPLQPPGVCSGTAPIYLLNGQVYYYYGNVPDENGVYVANDSICFRNATQSMHFVELCHQQTEICNKNFETLTMFTTIHLKVANDHCTSYTTMDHTRDCNVSTDEYLPRNPFTKANQVDYVFVDVTTMSSKRRDREDVAEKELNTSITASIFTTRMPDDRNSQTVLFQNCTSCNQSGQLQCSITEKDRENLGLKCSNSHSALHLAIVTTATIASMSIVTVSMIIS